MVYGILAIFSLTYYNPHPCFDSLPISVFSTYFPTQWHFLHAFVNSFQGSYKDGTEPGTYD